jgi:signal transduction histidine kinase
MSRTNRTETIRGYRGGYLIGFIIIAAVALRTLPFYRGQQNFIYAVSLLASYSLLYLIEPWLTVRYPGSRLFYFSVQTCAVVVLTNLRPFTDVSSLLYVPLCTLVYRAFSRRAVTIWLLFWVVLLSFTLMRGLGWLVGLALVLLYLAVCAFLISYDVLYRRTQTDQAESQRLLEDLQAAHKKLQEYAMQVEELAAARERNRLARELHDSVSQEIFSITLTSQSARLLLEREPERVTEQINHLQEMTSNVLSRLRSLISELHPL